MNNYSCVIFIWSGQLAGKTEYVQCTTPFLIVPTDWINDNIVLIMAALGMQQFSLFSYHSICWLLFRPIDKSFSLLQYLDA